MNSSSSSPPQIHATIETDLLLLRLDGDYTLDVATYTQMHFQQLMDEYGYRLSLIDVQRAGTIHLDARRFLLEQRRNTKLPGAVAIVGANFAVRTLAHMVLKALHTLTKSYMGVDFFPDEATARIWLNQERNRLRAALNTN